MTLEDRVKMMLGSQGMLIAQLQSRIEELEREVAECRQNSSKKRAIPFSKKTDT